MSKRGGKTRRHKSREGGSILSTTRFVGKYPRSFVKGRDGLEPRAKHGPGGSPVRRAVDPTGCADTEPVLNIPAHCGTEMEGASV